jgi:hypothetical protein
MIGALFVLAEQVVRCKSMFKGARDVETSRLFLTLVPHSPGSGKAAPLSPKGAPPAAFCTRWTSLRCKTTFKSARKIGNVPSVPHSRPSLSSLTLRPGTVADVKERVKILTAPFPRICDGDICCAQEPLSHHIQENEKCTGENIAKKDSQHFGPKSHKVGCGVVTVLNAL